jgi:hypothetical protein
MTDSGTPMSASATKYDEFQMHEDVSKTFRTESIRKPTFTFGITRSEATQRVTAAKLTSLTHKIAIQLHLVVESCTIYSPRSRWPVRKLLDTSSYKQFSVTRFEISTAVNSRAFTLKME